MKVKRKKSFGEKKVILFTCFILWRNDRKTYCMSKLLIWYKYILWSYNQLKKILFFFLVKNALSGGNFVSSYYLRSCLNLFMFLLNIRTIQMDNMTTTTCGHKQPSPSSHESSMVRNIIACNKINPTFHAGHEMCWPLTVRKGSLCRITDANK